MACHVGKQDEPAGVRRGKKKLVEVDLQAKHMKGIESEEESGIFSQHAALDAHGSKFRDRHANDYDPLPFHETVAESEQHVSWGKQEVDTAGARISPGLVPPDYRTLRA